MRWHMHLFPESCPSGQGHPKSHTKLDSSESFQVRPHMQQSWQQDVEASTSQILVTTQSHGAAFITQMASLKASTGSAFLPVDPSSAN